MAIRSLMQQLQAVGCAFQFMTRVPVPVAIPFTPDVLARSVIYYPLVGAVIGGLLSGAGWLLAPVVPPMPAAVLLLTLWIGLSGALHLDGLMDTADGVLSHRSRERMLDIMKDSRVGAMGVMAAVLLLLFKFAMLAELQDGGSWMAAAPLIASTCIFSRMGIVAAIKIWPFARPGEGLASMFAGLRMRHFIGALLLHIAIVMGGYALFGISLSKLLLIIFIQTAITLIVGLIVNVWLTRKLGGLTGDTYGALNELLEAVLLLAVLWLLPLLH
ncbi:Adenosylcobinamide-GDP ribazoletransferase [Paenibacillus plantiphilus]|uniref:Adenosylcobinamide-GDP ribazoletransferase n=1 Tax=Paenibacillus plantiphilus TaxID=2905650 RepID=A0ABM9BYY0_9BACL|nr:adenosylcobinamide-GDP ribazoletransferase [Paenibacillus plantiphilus]CAH1197706.1 Adenosylcobinamide-GDP ribazoletransferase [Paenibacillus plantiphilus]